MADEKIKRAPKVDTARKEVLIVQEAQTLIKETIIKGCTDNKERKSMFKDCVDIIVKYKKLLPVNMQKEFVKAMNNLILKDYHFVDSNFKTITKNINSSTSKVTGYSISSIGDLMKVDAKQRGYKTDRRNGLPTIKDYQEKVRDVVKTMSADSGDYTSVKNGKSYKCSIRNLAEMQVRYEANMDDLKEFEDAGVDLVWTSSHVDCSKRCEDFQGKLYSISGKHCGETIDGNKVEDISLKEAMAGKNGDGNGILQGYNCRHYVIEYRSGSKAPIEYNKNEIEQERNINTRQRQYESNIRQLKMQAKMQKASGNDEVAERLTARVLKIEKGYKLFSLKNGRAFYPWRTNIMRGETIESNRFGEDTVQEIEQELGL